MLITLGIMMALVSALCAGQATVVGPQQVPLMITAIVGIVGAAWLIAYGLLS